MKVLTKQVNFSENLHIFVDLQGFEPWSKQETPKLSTRLFCYPFSSKVLKQTPNTFAYPFHSCLFVKENSKTVPVNDAPLNAKKQPAQNLLAERLA